MRLYRGLKNPYRPERVGASRSAGGTDFTDCPAIALRYAQGSRSVVLVVDIDPDERHAFGYSRLPSLVRYGTTSPVPCRARPRTRTG